VGRGLSRESRAHVGRETLTGAHVGRGLCARVRPRGQMSLAGERCPRGQRASRENGATWADVSRGRMVPTWAESLLPENGAHVGRASCRRTVPTWAESLCRRTVPTWAKPRGRTVPTWAEVSARERCPRRQMSLAGEGCPRGQRSLAGEGGSAHVGREPRAGDLRPRGQLSRENGAHVGLSLESGAHVGTARGNADARRDVATRASRRPSCRRPCRRRRRRACP
jgi:hypothetical protein